MISFRDADRAAEELAEALDDCSWLNGVAVEQGESGDLLVTVRVNNETSLEQAQREGHIPPRVQGVPVLLKHEDVAESFDASDD